MQRRKMMRRGARIIALSLTLLLMGCVPSLYPIYTAESVIFDRSLVGEWQRGSDDKTKAQEEFWSITKVEGRDAYVLTRINKNGQRGTYSLHLCRVQDKMFINLYPKRSEPRSGSPRLFDTSFVSAHNFAYCQRIDAEDGWDIRFMNAAWLATHLRKKPDALDHRVVTKKDNDPNHIVITADSLQLQKFAFKHASMPGAYVSGGRLTRR